MIGADGFEGIEVTAATGWFGMREPASFAAEGPRCAC
jgi:hypothetical protein